MPEILNKAARLEAIASLEPHPRNPNVGDVPAIAESIKANGFYGYVVGREGTRQILAGWHTTQALASLGEKRIPVVWVEVDDETAERIVLADNRTAEKARRDPEKLAELLQAQRSLEGTGYTRRDRETALRKLRENRARLEVPEPPPLPDVPKSEPGIVYELGRHRILCGDSTDPATRALLMGDELADCVFTDPPYAIFGSSSGFSASITDDEVVRPFFLEVLRAAQDMTKLFAGVYVCCDWRSWPGFWESAKRLTPAGDRSGIVAKNLVIWNKGRAGLGNNWANSYECIGYFVHMPKQGVMTEARLGGIRAVLRANMIEAAPVRPHEKHHNAEKPCDLIREVLEAGSDPGALIVDHFAGSGPTLLTCEATDRTCYLLDKDPRYVDVVRRRYADLVGDRRLAP